MIKPNELRIGNWVYSKNHNWYYKVILLEYDKELNAEPIQLTEEILIKCGFKKFHKATDYVEFIKFIDNTRQYQMKLYTFDCTENWENTFAFYGTIQSKIQYLHQLQNLYFALTNEELTIQL